MGKRACEAVKKTLERFLATHFDQRPFGHIHLKSAPTQDLLQSYITLNDPVEWEDVVEYCAELNIIAPLAHERRLLDRMLEAIDFLHEAEIPRLSDYDGLEDPIIIASKFQNAIFEQSGNTEQASARLIFSIRTIFD